VSTVEPLEESAVYPRVYGASGGWLVTLTTCGSALALAGIAGAWFFATERIQSPRASLWLAGLCMAFAVLGIYCVLSTVRSRMVLFSDRIEVEELTLARSRVGNFVPAAFVVDRSLRGKIGTLIGLLVFSSAYGYGTAIEANALLDHSTGDTYLAHVEGKHIVSGRTTTYNLDLGPWGPKTKSSKLDVTRAMYNTIERGDLVYLTLKRGALGVNWYFMRQWQRGDHTRMHSVVPAEQQPADFWLPRYPGHSLGR